jgi:hypothetical protein
VAELCARGARLTPARHGDSATPPSPDQVRRSV